MNSWEELVARAAAIAEKEVAVKARERIDVRLRPEQKALIETAARIKGLTLTDFIVQNAFENARQAIREHETWTLERPDAELFAAALAAPPSLGPRLAKAAKRYRASFLRQ
jgi:uncharacterized protein (DUF1778 family)